MAQPAISVWKESVLEAARACNLPVADLAVFLNTQDPKDLENACQQVWLYVSHKLLTADMPLATHQALYGAVYSAWPRQRRGPPPMWLPDPAREPDHNVTRFLQHFKGDAEFEGARGAGGASDWQQLHALSVRDPERVLSAVMLTELALPLHKKPRRVLRLAPRPDDCQWLPGAALNIAWCALHTPRGGPGADNQPAVAWAEEGRPEAVHTLNRRQLRALALHVAACLKKRGLAPGDAVAVVLPLTPVSTAVYLGIALSGCVVVSIADSFAAHEIEARLRIARAKLVVTQDVVMRGGKPLPLLPRVIEGTRAPAAVVIPGAAQQKDLIDAFMTGSSRGQQGPGTSPAGLRACDLSWATFMTSALPEDSHAAACLPATSTPPGLHVATPSEATNILFSSGTTGEPKAIVWDHVIPLRAAVDGWAHQGIQAGERVCWPTSLGWMMGPWLIYAALLNGGCITLYNGAPLGRDFGLFVRSAGVHMLGLVPSIVKVWRHSGCMKGLSWPSLKAISSTGEASAPDDYHWLYAATGYKVPILEYIGGTELGGSYATGSLLQPASPCTFSTPSLGTQLVLMVPAQAAKAIGLPLVECQGGPVGLSLHAVGAPPGAGEVALVAPSLGGAQRLLNKDHHKVYYEGMPAYPPTGRPLRRHGDELCRLPGGYYTALGRVDDTMNLGGIKVASVELERAVMEGVATVSEVAAVGVPTPGGGPEQLVLFVVLRPGQTANVTELMVACQTAIRGQLNPLFKVERVVVVGALPRNASNKLMRRTLRDKLLAAQQPRSKL